MAQTKVTAKTSAKPAAKKAPATRKSSAGKVKAGDTFTCEVCGLSVVVDELCGCAEAHEILCCETPMKKKSKAAAK